MASENCGNCIHCEYKKPEEKHIGSPSDKPDWWCWLYEQWLKNPAGNCKNYVGK